MKKSPKKTGSDLPEDNEPELFEKVVHINRCAKVVKGGRRFSFAALVVVGDQSGNVGFGYGKAQMVPDAIHKGTEQAKKAMRNVSISGDTLPHPVLGTHDGGKVMLRQLDRELVLLQEEVRAVLEAAGVGVLSIVRFNNHLSVVSATLDGLLQLRTASQISGIQETVLLHLHMNIKNCTLEAPSSKYRI